MNHSDKDTIKLFVGMKTLEIEVNEAAVSFNMTILKKVLHQLGINFGDNKLKKKTHILIRYKNTKTFKIEMFPLGTEYELGRF